MAGRRDSKNRVLNKGEYQRPDGRYAYKYVDVNGMNRWVYSWTLTDSDRAPAGKEATQSLRAMEVEIERSLADGISLKDAKILTLNECFEIYLGTKIKIKDITKVSYQKIWSYYVEDSIGKRRIGDLRYSDLVKYFGGLIQKEGLKQSSVKNVYLLVKPTLDMAVRDNLIKSNPSIGALDAVRTREGISEKKRALTLEQQEVFLSFLENSEKYRKLYRLVIFLLGTGCRIGEARGLTWNDCDFNRGVIHIKRQMQYYKASSEEAHREHVTTLKTRSSKRMIPMFQTVRNVLLEERLDQERLRLRSVTIDGVSGFIFIKSNGSIIEVRDAFVEIKSAIRACNLQEARKAKLLGVEPIEIPHFSPHNLRHTFCTRLYNNEPNIKVVQEIMGHADASVTMNVYTDIENATKIKSFERIDGKIV